MKGFFSFYFNKAFNQRIYQKLLQVAGLSLILKKEKESSQFLYLYEDISKEEQQNNYITENDIETKTSKIYFQTELAEQSTLKIFSGSSHRDLAKEIAAHLDIQLGRLTLNKYTDGEYEIQCQESVTGQKVYLIQSMTPPSINESLMELIFMISAMKREGASKVICIIPYLGYSRQTSASIDNERNNILAPTICSMLETVGCDEIITINFHKRELKGFFKIPCLNIDASELIIPYIIHKNLSDAVLISSSARSSRVHQTLHIKTQLEYFNQQFNFGLMNEQYSGDKQFCNYEYVGDEVKGKDCFILSDILDSGKTLQKFSTILKDLGARNIYFYANHGLFTEQCVKIINKSYIKEVLTSNTLPFPYPTHRKIKHISVSKLISDIIALNYKGVSLDEYRQSKSLLRYAHQNRVQGESDTNNVSNQ